MYESILKENRNKPKKKRISFPFVINSDYIPNMVGLDHDGKQLILPKFCHKIIFVVIIIVSGSVYNIW